MHIGVCACIYNICYKNPVDICCCCRNVFHYPFKVSFLVALFTSSKLVNGSQQKMNKKDVLHFYRHWKCLGKCL